MCCIYCLDKPFTLYHITFTEGYPHDIFAAEGGYAHTRKKINLAPISTL